MGRQSGEVLRQRLPVRPLSVVDHDAALEVCARDRVANAFVAARIVEGSLRSSPGRAPGALGRRGAARPRAGSARTSCRSARRGRRGGLRGADQPDAPAVRLDLRPERAGRAASGTASARRGARCARCAPPAAADDARRARRLSAWRSTRGCARPGSTRSTSCCPLRRTCSPRRSATRPTSAPTAATGRASPRSSGARPHLRQGRGRRGRLQGRRRLARPRLRPGAGGRGCTRACAGQGLSVPAMASVVEQVLSGMADEVSLYVNDFNAAARATYDPLRLPRGRGLHHGAALAPRAPA